MTAPARTRVALSVDRWYRRALPAYWIFLAFTTHFPKLRVDFGVEASDKFLHLIAFAGLAYLFWKFVESFARPLSGRFVFIAAGVLIAYSALDEYTQGFVNRGREWLDFWCDVAGIVVTLSALETMRRVRAARPGRSQVPSSAS